MQPTRRVPCWFGIKFLKFIVEVNDEKRIQGDLIMLNNMMLRMLTRVLEEMMLVKVILETPDFEKGDELLGLPED